MTKKQASMAGARAYDYDSGEMATIASVTPHGKTSARFNVLKDGENNLPYPYTESEFRKRFVMVAADYKHDLPPLAGRVQRMIDHIDNKEGGRLPYCPGHFTEMHFAGKHNGLRYVDRMTLASPFGSSGWRLHVWLWGANAVNIEVTRDQVTAAGGHLWPAFKPLMEAIVSPMREGAEGGGK